MLYEIHAKHNAVAFRRDIGRKAANKEQMAIDQSAGSQLFVILAAYRDEARRSFLFQVQGYVCGASVGYSLSLNAQCTDGGEH